MKHVWAMWRAAIVAALLGQAVGATAQTVLPLGDNSFQSTMSVAIDHAGNLFIADTGNSVIKELTAASGYTTVNILTTAAQPEALAVDANDNLFVIGGYNLYFQEYLAPDYQTVKPLAGVQKLPFGSIRAFGGLAVDPNGNLFISGAFEPAAQIFQVLEIPAAGDYDSYVLLTDGTSNVATSLTFDASGNLFLLDGQVSELTASSGYRTSQLVVGASVPVREATTLALDAGGDIFLGAPNTAVSTSVATSNALVEIVAAGGYSTILPVAATTGDFPQVEGIALAPNGNIFVVGSERGISPPPPAFVDEVFEAPQPLAASILPGSRAVMSGEAATVFATLINAATTTADNCQVRLPITAFSPVTGYTQIDMSYQATDPTTNAPVGSPDTPISIPPGKAQSLILSFSSGANISAPGFAPIFWCEIGTPAVAPLVPGVNTVDLTITENGTADVIALEAVAGPDGILHVPTGGGGAFAIATDNVGLEESVTVSADTGSATLPLAVALCQTNAKSGKCLAPAAATLTLDFAHGGIPTFSVFASASSGIAVDPATSRVFVRFKDQSGTLVGSTSVAVSSP